MEQVDKKEKLKCKIVSAKEGWYNYIVIDKDYNIVANGVSSNESWVVNDAGGYHTRKDFDKLYGQDKWMVDFSDMYSNENERIKGTLQLSIVIEVE